MDDCPQERSFLHSKPTEETERILRSAILKKEGSWASLTIVHSGSRVSETVNLALRQNRLGFTGSLYVSISFLLRPPISTSDVLTIFVFPKYLGGEGGSGCFFKPGSVRYLPYLSGKMKSSGKSVNVA